MQPMILPSNGLKIVASGMTNQAAAVVRYNPNGSLDPTFGSGGIVTTLVPGGFFTAMKIQIDGRTLIGGDVQDESIVRVEILILQCFVTIPMGHRIQLLERMDK